MNTELADDTRQETTPWKSLGTSARTQAALNRFEHAIKLDGLLRPVKQRGVLVSHGESVTGSLNVSSESAKRSG